MRISSIGGWVKTQHQANPRLPNLSRKQLDEIVELIQVGDGEFLTHEEAVEMTDYPLKERGTQHQYWAVPKEDPSWVVEVRKKVVVSVLSAVNKPWSD